MHGALRSSRGIPALGNLQKAQNHIKVAVAAEPDNAEFKATLRSNNGSSTP